MAVRLSSLAARFPDMVTRTRQDGGVHTLLASAGGKARLAGTASRGPLFSSERNEPTPPQAVQRPVLSHEAQEWESIRKPWLT